tara:strand:+ start:3786 stop:3983 length:198 start_codon:yes stop_codon:yes gene_type:complete
LNDCLRFGLGCGLVDAARIDLAVDDGESELSPAATQEKPHMEATRSAIWSESNDCSTVGFGWLMA